MPDSRCLPRERGTPVTKSAWLTAIALLLFCSPAIGQDCVWTDWSCSYYRVGTAGGTSCSSDLPGCDVFECIVQVEPATGDCVELGTPPIDVLHYWEEYPDAIRYEFAIRATHPAGGSDENEFEGWYYENYTTDLQYSWHHDHAHNCVEWMVRAEVPEGDPSALEDASWGMVKVKYR